MFELKTISHKVDPSLLPVREVPVVREPSQQRRLMAVALVLLLVALGLLLYRDRDFWFPDNSEAEDQLDSAPAPANAGTEPATVKAVTTAVAPEKTREKKFAGAKPQPKLASPVASASDVTPAPPPATAVRTVLPPLEVEVVAGDTHSTIQPGTASVHVDLRPKTPPRVAQTPVQATAVAPPAATVTSNAAERVEMSSRATEVVGAPVRPSYPMLARQMKVQGSVILQALIGRDGSIQSLRVVSGPPILANAAQEAVRQWRFKPHYEGSEAVETQANITVNFTISTS